MVLETTNKDWPILNFVLIMVDFLPIENLSLDIGANGSNDNLVNSAHAFCHYINIVFL